MHPFQKSGFVARISSRITTVIRVVDTIKQTITDLMSLYSFLTSIIQEAFYHSKSPTLYNEALKSVGFDGVYVFLLVDDLANFLRTYSSTDFVGFSVTIPHKEAAVKCCDEVDPVESPSVVTPRDTTYIASYWACCSTNFGKPNLVAQGNQGLV
ncbi:hypothetical protein VNO77_34782 [Canavalia gladiata]|uniref:Shikimate dehydrogenase substrate binding N-terminal domain-containing protein n=1 Tax=Canavalia gladiata TaxID=3824 RepID=A0AAN9Q204_CANGL